MSLLRVSLDELIITDEASFAHVAVYARLKRVVNEAGHHFQIPARGAALSWDRAAFLNLTFWSAGEKSADVLCDASLSADVVAHIAWHHLAATQLARLVPDKSAPCAAALFFGEAIASAFDLYLVGRLLHNVPDSDFIATQVSIMAEAAEQAGLSAAQFAALLESVALDPERAFEDLRALLFDVACALLACNNANEAQLALESFAAHRFEALLHHYQLSNWVLYARAYAKASLSQEHAVQAIDATLRAAPVALDWLTDHWMAPAT